MAGNEHGLLGVVHRVQHFDVRSYSVWPPSSSWHTSLMGRAMVGSVYAFGVMFLAFGIVPQWIDHADKDLGWDRSKSFLGQEAS